MAINDQFDMGRLPIKLLPYSNRDLAQTREFMIDDVGENPSYHLYITDVNDRHIYIDLTNKIIKEILPDTNINANNFHVTIEGIDDPQTLKDLLNFLMKRFLYPDNAEGFNPSEDMWKLFDPTTKSVLLRDFSGTIYLPVTTADNVYDSEGRTIQERLDSMTRIGWCVDYIYVESPEQTTFKFTYPFPNYPNGGNFLEVRVGTTYVDKTRYAIIDDKDENGDIIGATLVFLGEALENKRRIDLIFIFNSVLNPNGSVESLSGGHIANNSIPSSKLEKTSDSYTLNDPTCLATSAAVYNLFMAMSDIINENADNALWVVDESDLANKIKVVSKEKPLVHGLLINVVLATEKMSSAVVEFYHEPTESSTTESLVLGSGEALTKGLPASKTIRILYYNNKFYLLSSDLSGLKSSRYIHTCVDQETVIPFDRMNYYTGCLMNVYRNGVRLFEDLDYTIDYTREEITLFVRTEEGERIVFEALYI